MRKLIHSSRTCPTESALTACCTPRLVLECGKWVRWLHKHFVERIAVSKKVRTLKVQLSIASGWLLLKRSPPSPCRFPGIVYSTVWATEWMTFFFRYYPDFWQKDWQCQKCFILCGWVRCVMCFVMVRSTVTWMDENLHRHLITYRINRVQTISEKYLTWI